MIYSAYLTGGRLMNKKLALISLSTAILALVTTQSRSAWIAFAVGFLYVTARAMRQASQH